MPILSQFELEANRKFPEKNDPAQFTFHGINHLKALPHIH